MSEDSDPQLIGRYLDEQSAGAIRELVQRHAALVYSAALRMLNGDTHLAEDVTQEVFVLLSRKSPGLRRHPSLTGWLYCTANFKASEAVRRERRRRAREQESQAMHESTTSTTGEPEWEKLRPELDAAMLELSDRDREAVLLRYFQAQPYAHIAARLNLSEAAAHKRVERALDRLRERFLKRGLASTSAALGALLTAQAAEVVPGGLVAAAGSAAAAAGAGGFWTTLATAALPIMTTANKTAAVIAALSLIANAALLGTMIARNEAPASAGSSTTETSVPVEPSPRAASGAAGQASPVPVGINLTAAQWSSLMSVDLKERVARMRAMGLPAEVVRRVAIEEINRQYTPRYLALWRADKPVAPFWTADASVALYMQDPRHTDEIDRFFHEWLGALKDVIGGDAYYALDSSERAGMDASTGDLSPEKKLDLMLGRWGLYAQMGRITLAAGGNLLPSDYQQINAIQGQLAQVKASLLTPEELAEDELINATGLRTLLAGFNPTEEEFKALYPIRQAFEKKYGVLMSTSTQAERDLWASGQKEYFDNVSAVLSPERAADFLVATRTAPVIARVTTRLGLPLSTAQQVLGAQTDAMQRVTALRNDRTLTPIARNQQLVQTAAEFSSRVAGLMGGPAGLEAYRLNAGAWMASYFPTAASGGVRATP